MSLSFPPEPAHKQQIEIMLEILSCAIDERNANYLSAPITSGKRFSDWQRRYLSSTATSSNFHNDYLREVVEPNRAQAQLLVKQLRAKLEGVLLDPTAVIDLPDWSQDDYRHLWARIIERYVKKAIFMDGWQYSNGCAYEFLTAHLSGVITLRQDLCPLTPENGIELLRLSIAEMQVEHQPTAFLDRVVKELENLRSKAAEAPCRT